jgi:hypothetical protein
VLTKAELGKQVLNHLRKIQKMPPLIICFFQSTTTCYATA